MMLVNGDELKVRLNDILKVINMNKDSFIQSKKDKGFEWDDCYKVDSFKLETAKMLITFIIDDIDNGDIV